MVPPDLGVIETGSTSGLVEQPFSDSAMGDSDLLPELSGETWVTTIHLDEATGDVPPSDSDPDLIESPPTDKTLIIARVWVWAGATPTWSD